MSEYKTHQFSPAYTWLRVLGEFPCTGYLVFVEAAWGQWANKNIRTKTRNHDDWIRDYKYQVIRSAVGRPVWEKSHFGCPCWMLLLLLNFRPVPTTAQYSLWWFYEVIRFKPLYPCLHFVYVVSYTFQRKCNDNKEKPVKEPETHSPLDYPGKFRCNNCDYAIHFSYHGSTQPAWQGIVPNIGGTHIIYEDSCLVLKFFFFLHYIIIFIEMPFYPMAWLAKHALNLNPNKAELLYVQEMPMQEMSWSWKNLTPWALQNGKAYKPLCRSLVFSAHGANLSKA